MSNHTGSYDMGNFLRVLHSYGVFEFLGKEKTREVLQEACECVSDGNDGEVLDYIGSQLSFCYYCKDYGDNLDHWGLCEKCRRSTETISDQ
jgi:hypothetical protein